MKITFRAIYLMQVAAISVCAQVNETLYDPTVDGAEQIKAAVTRSGTEGKFVLVQVGGNWCSWCHKLNKMVTEEEDISAFIDNNYIVVHLNYSKENENQDALTMLDYPQRFGFPVLVILDDSGERLHTQDSALLEADGRHSKEKVMRFLKLWSPSAVSGAVDAEGE